MIETNKEFSIKDKVFIKACEIASIAGYRNTKMPDGTKRFSPTIRQASKYRRNMGVAFRFKKDAIEALNKK